MRFPSPLAREGVRRRRTDEGSAPPRVRMPDEARIASATPHPSALRAATFPRKAGRGLSIASRGRRFAVSLLTASCLFAEPARCADANLADAAGIFKRICMSPSSEWIGLGAAEASRRGWQLDAKRSGRQYGIVSSAETYKQEPPVFDVRFWNVVGDSFNYFGVGIVGPEWPKLKANSCGGGLAGDHLDELLALVAKRLGLAIGDAKKDSSGNIRAWTLEQSKDEVRERSRFVVVTLQSTQSGFETNVGYLEYEIPKDVTGLPHQGIAP